MAFTVRNYDEQDLTDLKKAFDDSDAILIGAGSGLSTAAGFTYTGDRFYEYFNDFAEAHGFRDMYAPGFYPFQTEEERFAYWSRYIYINRYMDPPTPVYERLLDLVKGKEYFVLTTNVDHCFQKAGFDKERLFYTQGDYGLFQCSDPEEDSPCEENTFDNYEIIKEMVLAQGCTIDENGNLKMPTDGSLKRTVPSDLLPKCPFCGKPATTNLRSDDKFVQDEGWCDASVRYMNFMKKHQTGKVVYLEIGVGFNTPGIIKYNFWKRVMDNEDAKYVCLNKRDAAAPAEIADRSLCINADVNEILENVQKLYGI